MEAFLNFGKLVLAETERCSRLTVRGRALGRRGLLWRQHLYPHAGRQAVRRIDNHLIGLG